MYYDNCCKCNQTRNKWNIIEAPGISTPGIKIDTEGVSKTDGIVDMIDHVTKILATNATTIPTFMYHFQNVGEAHLVLQREADEIKVLYRVKALQRVQWDIALSHLLRHIRQRHENAFAPVVGNAVFKPVKYLHSEVAHAYLVGIGKAEREADVNLAFVL